MAALGDGNAGVVDISQHRFVKPEKAVKTITDMAVWEKSEAYNMEYTGFIATLNEAVKGKPLSADYKISDNLSKLMQLLEKVDKLIDSFPPIEQPQRFGNAAFRDWLAMIYKDSIVLLEEALPERFHTALPEVKVYLEESFGNATRIDYGTGHEISFIMFMCCLYKIGALTIEDNVACVFMLFNKYLEIARRLQTTYRMEPAGSHGVWSLDDYQFVPFIWGSAQLIDQPRIYPPVKFLEEDIIDGFSKEYVFLQCIKYIKEVKTGPFAEHSNQLWSISAVGSWSKINQGLIKMYKKEADVGVHHFGKPNSSWLATTSYNPVKFQNLVLGKFPVIQHIMFGSLLPIKKFSRNS